jgi:hypoxanthine phosphoribosyltransferase
MDGRLEVLISEARIRTRVAALARRIDADYRGRALSLVVVLKGAAVFAADLARRISLPVSFDFIAASSYGAGTTSSGRVRLAGLEGLDIAGRHVLVIEDILDTGRTSSAILDRLGAQRPASLALCALLRKPAAARLDLPVYAVGFDVADDFVVGYGMDHAERYRNLRGIHRLMLDRGAAARQDGGGDQQEAHQGG